MTPLLAVAVAAGAAAAGWRLGALTAGGAAVATPLGTAILAVGGWPAAAVLAVFFVGGSAVSRLLPTPPTAFDPKGDRRDPWQVLANGGPAALGALLAPPAAPWIVTGALAAAAADTFATTLGLRSPRPPRDVLTGRTVPPGTSGGVTLWGTAGAALGAALVAATGAAVTGALRLFPIALAVGILGMGADAALGSAAQARFECPTCRLPSERRRHRCGTATTRRGGWGWLTNDGVNALATGAAALAAWGAWWRWGS